jgi:hypothetical protein
MQHLLDFIHEHTLEQQLFIAVSSAEGDLELLWQRWSGEDNVWQVQLRGKVGETALIHAGDLLDHLESRGADMEAIERELQTMVVVQIAFADVVLQDARQVLGADAVRRAVVGYRGFVSELQATAERIAPSERNLVAVPGAGDAQTEPRTGHLKLVR